MKAKKQKFTQDERLQVRARKLVGHDFALKKDGGGRDRLVKGTQESARKYDIASGGTVVNVRTVDPLQGISSLSEDQISAGRHYHKDYETCEREGLKTGSWEMRVDGGGGEKDRPQRIIDAHTRLAGAIEAMGYGEIAKVIQHVCGEGMSIAEVSRVGVSNRDVPDSVKRANAIVRRDSIKLLLTMGLDKLAVYYRVVPVTK